MQNIYSQVWTEEQEKKDRDSGNSELEGKGLWGNGQRNVWEIQFSVIKEKYI